MKKRILAWLMVFVMLVSALPTTAFAKGGNGQGGGNGHGGDQTEQTNGSNLGWYYAVITEKSGGGYTMTDPNGAANDYSNKVTVTYNNGTTMTEGVSGRVDGLLNQSGNIVVSCSAGYYISYIILACDNNGNTDDPFNCRTSGTESAFGYELAGSIPSSVTLPISELYEHANHDSHADSYYLMIMLEPRPTPVYVGYDSGTINGTDLIAVPVEETEVAGATKVGSYPTWAYTVNPDADNPSHTVLGISAAAEAEANTYGYTFSHWQLDYWRAYDADTNAFTTAHGLGSGTKNKGDTVSLSVHAKLVAVWKQIETKDITVKKVWNDDGDRDGIRPSEITVRLYADGVDTGKTVTLNSENSWTATFEKVQVMVDGKTVSYTVDEDSFPSGYTKTVDGYTITNTHEVAKTSVSVSKTWDDADNQDGIRTGSVTIKLLANDVDTGKTVTLSADNGWSATFENLDKNANGSPITYTVEEVAVTGYEASVSGSAADGYVVTNTHTPEKVSVSGSKTWNDADNQDGVRPASITINLLANGEKVASKEVTAADGWAWSFENLDKYADGEEISYTITEDAVSGYTSSVSGYDVTNTHTPETIEISGSKTWNDADNQDGIRPESITIRLLADGTEVDSKTVSEEDNWAWTFTNLPKNAAGKAISYTITEGAVDGYESSVDGYDVTNTHTPEKVSVSGSKTWNDNDNQDGKRPASITINLLANGEKVASKTVTEEDNWAWSFTDLPVYKDGKKIEYTITEDAVSGYTSSVNGYNVTNTHTPETIDISGSKTWDDAENQDGKRPASITINLLANGEKVASKTVTEKDGWAWTFTNLPKYENGAEIKYTITEETVGGYDTTVNGYDVTNTHAPEKTEVKVTKVWDDAENQDGKRPESITIKLLAGGEETGKTLVLNADNSWSGSFTDLDVYAGGEEIAYSIDEVSVDGYETKITGDAATGYTVTNSYTPETTSVSGSKTWDDNDNQDGKRPESITIRLLANGKEVDSKVVTGGDWTWEFTDLPVYANGTKIEYTITEDEVTDYTSEVVGYNVTNTHKIEKTDITVTKKWVDDNNRDGLQPESIEVQLYAGETACGDPVVLSADNEWTYTWEKLDVYSGGKAIAYTVKEITEIDGYTAAVTGTAADGYTITNTHEAEKTEVKVTKAWDDAGNQDGIRPDEVFVQLYANGTASGEAVSLNVGNEWTYTWKDLYVKEKGEAITYTVEEVEVPELYETSTSGNAEDGYIITNSYTPETTSVTVNKVWDDANNQDGKRPSSVTVTLWAGGEKTEESVTLNAENDWTATFDNLAKNAAGQPIAYTVAENSVEGYSAKTTGDAESGYTIINSYTPEKTNVQVVKAWDDAADQDGLRPDSITVKLMAGDEDTGKTLELTAESNWSGTFADLDKYKDGEEIAYTVEEADVADGYTIASIATDTNTGVITVTNAHEVEKTEFTVTKVWNDDDDRDSLRPESIEVQLYAGETAYGNPVTLSADNEWTYTWTGLNKNANGAEIVYTVVELDEIEGYTTNVDGGTITNTHEIETTSVTVNKVWEDANDQDGKRPDSIPVQLLADGKETGKTLVLNESNQWTGTFTGLPVNDNGAEIEYTVVETFVPEGYESKVDGFTITNTHEVEKTEVKVTKVWNDANNQDGKRPAEITVELLADGEKTGKTLTLSESNSWAGAFADLDKYADGTEITYSVAEVTVPEEYTSSISGDANNGFTITNSSDPKKTSVSVTKVWEDVFDQDGIRPDSITVKLLANGEDTGKTLTLDGSNGWKGAFTDLDAYANGVAITYDVEEIQVEGYEVSENWNENGTAVTLVNRHKVALTSVTVTKAWDDADNQDGKRPDSVAVQLMADGVAASVPVILNAENQWTFTWEILPVNAAGKAIAYTVEEITEIDGYTAAVTGTAADGYTITNTHTPETTSLTVNKVWDDVDNQDGKRPESVTVVLLANGEDTGKSVTLNEENAWTDSFTDLAKYEAGQEIAYTVAENKVEGYNASIAYEGTTATVTNAYTPEITSVQVVKVWEDEADQDGIRPDAITVRLYADGEDTEKTLELTADSKWTGAFEELAKYEAGKEIVYTVEEETVAEGYTVESIVADPETGIVKITNVHETATTEVSVSKEWDDEDDQDGLRTESVTIVLYADGEKIDSVELSEKNDWKHTFTDLQLNNGGQEITYTVKEVKIDGYTVAYKQTKDGWKVVNTHEPETKEVTVSKVWYDNNDASGLRPDSITAQLYKNGEAWGDKFELSSDNNWKTDFELPVYEDGEEIEWTIKEVKVPKWYNVSYKQSTLTIMNTIQSDGSAKTGDGFNVWLWISIMGVCAVAVVGILVVSKKKKKG